MVSSAAAPPSSDPALAGGPVALVYLRLLAMVAIWGGFFVVAKTSVSHAPPLAVVLGRYLVALVIFGGLLAVAPAHRGVPTRRQAALLAVMAVTGLFGFNVAAFVGVQWAPASDAAVIMPVLPAVFTLALAAGLLREYPMPVQLAGIAVVLAGEALIFREAITANALSGARLRGDLLFVTAAVLWSVYTITARRLGSGLSPFAATTWSTIAGVVLLIPFGTRDLVQAVRHDMTPGFAWDLLYLGALQTVLGLSWWNLGVARLGAARCAVMNTLVPVFALIFSALILDERPSVERWIGVGIVIVGVVIAAVGPRLRPKRGASTAAAAPPHR